jgi:hypothetical protein
MDKMKDNLTLEIIRDELAFIEDDLFNLINEHFIAIPDEEEHTQFLIYFKKYFEQHKKLSSIINKIDNHLFLKGKNDR